MFLYTASTVSRSPLCRVVSTHDRARLASSVPSRRSVLCRLLSVFASLYAVPSPPIFQSPTLTTRMLLTPSATSQFLHNISAPRPRYSSVYARTPRFSSFFSSSSPSMPSSYASHLRLSILFVPRHQTVQADMILLPLLRARACEAWLLQVVGQEPNILYNNISWHEWTVLTSRGIKKLHHNKMELGRRNPIFESS
jgi:hypothetical protein